MPSEGQDRGQRFDETSLAVRNRDAGRCRRCQRAERETRLSVHHLIPDTELPEDVDSHLPVNLVTLCRECHGQMESEPLFRQLSKIDVKQYDELMLSEDTRQKLNDRLENVGTEILKVKGVSEEESLDFLERLSLGSEQRSLDDF